MNLEGFRHFTIKSHGSQMYGKKPYIYHLDHVIQVLCRFGYHDNINILIGGLGHDLIEDTDVTFEDLMELFPNTREIPYMIDGVTDLEGIFENRYEQKVATFTQKTAKNKDAIIIKMADRIANVEATLAENLPKYLKSYVKEFPLFRDLLHASDVDLNMYCYLNSLNNIAKEKIE